MANGMTTNADRTLVYVSDPVARTVNVLRRQSSGKLVLDEVIDLPYSADNLEMDHQTGIHHLIDTSKTLTDEIYLI